MSNTVTICRLPGGVHAGACPTCGCAPVQDWTPTPDNVNALPEPLRRYVHQLVSDCDPQGTIRENFQLREENAGLRRECQNLAAGLAAAIRAAELALFVVRKQGVMPNASWEAGFNADMATAKAARPANAESPPAAPTSR